MVSHITSNYGDLGGGCSILIKNSSVPTSLVYSVTTSDNAIIKFFELPTVLESGRLLSISSLDRTTKYFPPATVSSNVNVEDEGFLLHSYLSVGSVKSNGGVWVLDPDTDYLVVIERTAGEGVYNIDFLLEEVMSGGVYQQE